MWEDQDQHHPNLIQAALREAVMSGKLNFRYIDRILFEWKKNGIKTVDQAQNQGQKFRANQQRAQQMTKQETKFTGKVPFIIGWSSNIGGKICLTKRKSVIV